jgi:O-antigen/teichoic acid export membrane protein
MLIENIKLIFKKRTIGQAAYVYAGSVINGLSLFALNIVLARFLTQEHFAIFSLSVLVLSTVAEMSDFGLNGGLLRFAPYYIATNQASKLNQLVKIIWQWRLSLSVFLTIGCLLFAGPLSLYIFNQPQVRDYFAFAAFGIGGIIMLGFLATFLQSQQRFFYNASLQSLKGVLRLLLVLGLALFGIKNIYIYLAIYICVPWILFLMHYKVLPKDFRKTVINNDEKSALHAQLAKFSFWLTVASFTSIIAARVDQIMISRLLTLADVAMYTVAYQLIQFFPLIYSSIASVLTPKISALSDKAQLAGFVKKTFIWTSSLTVIVALFIYPSQYLINILFGAKYAQAMPVYLVLAYSLILNILAIPFSLTINVFNRTYLVALAGIFQIILSVVGNLILIPAYGVMGAAYTFALGIAASLLYSTICAIFLIKRTEVRIN